MVPEFEGGREGGRKGVTEVGDTKGGRGGETDKRSRVVCVAQRWGVNND